MNILALEASTSSAKAILYSKEQGVLGAVTLPYPADVSDVLSQDPRGVYRTLMECANRALAGRKEKVSAIGLAGIWHSLLLLDSNRRPLGRITTWADTAAGETAAEYRKDKDFTQWFYGRTGCMVHSIYPVWQYIHMKKKNPRLISQACFLSSQSEYIFERLTGEVCYSRTTASGSGMMNIHSLEWDEEILHFAGISKDMLGTLREPGYTAPLLPQAAEELGLDEGIPVVIGGSDGALNQIGGGAMEEGIMTFSVGTSGAIRMVSRQPLLPQNPSTWCYYLAEGKRIAGAATSGAGNCVEWFVKKAHAGKYSFDELEKEMVSLNFKDGHPMDVPVFLPFLYGERCPGWQDQRMGSFFNLKGNHQLGHLYHALLEGILFNIYHCYQILVEVGTEPKEIRITGGIEKSETWLQMAADIFQKELVTSPLEHASTMGAVALTLKSVGELEALEQFQVPTERKIIPDARYANFYRERFQEYLKWYEKTGE